MFSLTSSLPQIAIPFCFFSVANALFRAKETALCPMLSALCLSTLSLHTEMGPVDGTFSPSAADVIHLLEEGYFFFCVVKEVELDIAIDEAAEFDPDEADQLTAFVDFGKQLKGVSNECSGLGGIRDSALAGEGIEIGIADLDGHAAGELGILAQLEGQFVDHGPEHAADKFKIECVFTEGPFLGHRFLFAIRHDLPTVDGIGALPEEAAHFSKLPIEELDRYIPQNADGPDPHKAEFFVGFFADPRDLGGGQRG